MWFTSWLKKLHLFVVENLENMDKNKSTVQNVNHHNASKYSFLCVLLIALFVLCYLPKIAPVYKNITSS